MIGNYKDKDGNIYEVSQHDRSPREYGADSDVLLLPSLNVWESYEYGSEGNYKETDDYDAERSFADVHADVVGRGGVCLPVYMTDHSGVTLKHYPTCKWDTVPVGLHYLQAKDMQALGLDMEGAIEYLKDSLAMLSDFYNGEAYYLYCYSKDGRVIAHDLWYGYAELSKEIARLGLTPTCSCGYDCECEE